MAITIRQSARARLISPGPTETAMMVALCYASSDPLAIRIIFPAYASRDGAEATWAFGRQLLARGVRVPAGAGDVHVWPCGRARMVVELHALQGTALVEFDRSDVERFLLRSYDAVPDGCEEVDHGLDLALVRLLDEV